MLHVAGLTRHDASLGTIRSLSMDVTYRVGALVIGDIGEIATVAAVYPYLTELR